MGIRSALAIATATCALTLGGGAASAENSRFGEYSIDGAPLDIGFDLFGDLSAQFDGAFSQSDLFGFSGNGLNLAFGGELWGFIVPEARQYVPVSPPLRAGAGTAASPWTLTTVYDAGSPVRLRVTQTVSYVDGDRHFRVRYAIANVGGAPVGYRASLATLLWLALEPALGRSAAGPPRTFGAFSPATGTPLGLNDPPADWLRWGQSVSVEELTPWTHADLDESGLINEDIRRIGESGFDDTFSPRLEDPAIGVQWDVGSLDPGATAVHDVVFRLSNELLTTPYVATVNEHLTHTVRISTRQAEGGPQPARRIGFDLQRNVGNGPNQQGVVLADAAGEATISWRAANTGQDELYVWPDDDGNGRWDSGHELRRKAWVNWTFVEGATYGPGGPATPGSGGSHVDLGPPAPATPPGTPPAGRPPAGQQPPGATGVRRSPRLRALSVRRLSARRLLIRARVDPLAGRAVTATLRAGGRRATARGRPRSGRVRLVLRIPRTAARRGRLVVRYPGDARLVPQSLRRSLRL